MSKRYVNCSPNPGTSCLPSAIYHRNQGELAAACRHSRLDRLVSRRLAGRPRYANPIDWDFTDVARIQPGNQLLGLLALYLRAEISHSRRLVPWDPVLPDPVVPPDPSHTQCGDYKHRGGDQYRPSMSNSAGHCHSPGYLE